MSYGLNIEMHKQVNSSSSLFFLSREFSTLMVCLSLQAEIVKRLNGICAQVLPYLSQEVRVTLLTADAFFCKILETFFFFL